MGIAANVSPAETCPNGWNPERVILQLAFREAEKHLREIEQEGIKAQRESAMQVLFGAGYTIHH